MCLQKSGVPAELDVWLLLRLTRNEFERTATPAASSEVLLLYFALDDRFLPRTLYLGMTCKQRDFLQVNLLKLSFLSYLVLQDIRYQLNLILIFIYHREEVLKSLGERRCRKLATIGCNQTRLAVCLHDYIISRLR